ncbi:MAG: hypothetical protein V9F04_03935 [Dermatophilaceae bacterium]
MPAPGAPSGGDRRVTVSGRHALIDIPADVELVSPVRIRRQGDGSRALSHIVLRVRRPRARDGAL